MSESDQVKWFVGEVQRVVNQAAAEFSMTVATVVGALEMVKLDLVAKQSEEPEQ